MKPADKITSLRLILAPVFFYLYLHPGINGTFFESPVQLAVLWLLFIIIESSDWLDGQIARRRNEVSDFGKLWDPFADTLARITYFLCFVSGGILPVIPFLVIIFREYGILFIRVLMMQKGVALGARKGGKFKAVCYALTGFACLFSVTLDRLGFADSALLLRNTAIAFFILSMTAAVISFIDYFIVLNKTKSLDTVQKQ